MIIRFVLAAATVASLALAAAPSRADEAHDSAAIRGLMKGQFERPEAPLAVDPLVVLGDHALAGWIQGDMGGRALLGKRHGKWTILFCSGDALKSAKTLTELGIAKEAAAKLEAELAAAEGKMEPARRAMLSRFDGLVKIGEDGHHPPAHGQHPPQHGPKKDGHEH